jgi:Tfp pilus assembly protein PilX
MNQQGYILPFCLLFLLLISTLSLAVITQNYWQKNLAEHVIDHQQKQANIIATVSDFFNNKQYSPQAGCTVTWQDFDQVWQQLATGEKYCLTKQGGVRLRYIQIIYPEKQPQQFAIIARADDQSAWQAFLIRIAN